MDQKSKEKLKGVDERLVQVAELAFQLSPITFRVTEGLRTKERQQELYAKKLSKTLNSKHITGKAFDVVILRDGKAIWDIKDYKALAVYFKEAAKQLNVKIECGADWGWDGPHIELKD